MKEKSKHLEQRERIQKILSSTGICSRREAERWIEAGKIEVDGEKATLGQKIQGNEKITLNKKLLKIKKPLTSEILLYYKPVGEICTRKDPKERRTVFESLPKIDFGKWISIGRLDFRTSGLLLFANKGEIAYHLSHPSSKIEREYIISIRGKVQSRIVDILLKGVRLDDGFSKFHRITPLKTASLHSSFCVSLFRGRNREVRRLWESQGLFVRKLKRVRFGKIKLPENLNPGDYSYLTHEEINYAFPFLAE